MPCSGGFTLLECSFEVVVSLPQMHCVGALPSYFTFPMVVKSSAHANAIEEGEHIHCMVAKRSFKLNAFVETVLIHMFSTIREVSVRDAYKVFGEMRAKNVFT